MQELAALAADLNDNLMRQVLEACPLPISMTRLGDGVVLYDNPACRALFGDAAVDAPVRDVYTTPETDPLCLAQLRDTGQVDDLEIEVARPGGETLPVAWSARLIKFQGQAVVVSTAKDLRERRVLEEEMHRQREALHQREKLSALGELLASVAHELNNPLSVVVGQALLMSETATDPKTVERADKIGAAAERCSRIVKAFLAMARQEPASRTEIDPNLLVRSALDLNPADPADHIKVRVRLARQVPAVHGDLHQLVQVVGNLLRNAQHALRDSAGPRELKVTTTYRAKTGIVVIKVKDNGPGVDPDIRTRIFEPLFTTKQVGNGIGIGLALCHRIVESHGGTLHLERERSPGAVFSIRLPTVTGPRAAEAPKATAAREVAAQRVLVIDDESEVAATIADIVRAGGHHAECVHSGTLALERLAEHQFDTIISDIRMPGLDGRKLFRALDQVAPEMVDRIIFITGDSLTRRVRDFLHTSGRPYLEKPVRPSEVLNLLRATSQPPNARRNIPVQTEQRVEPHGR
ncbi:MAG: ATP-binding protein [Pseudomonadota bacterium]